MTLNDQNLEDVRFQHLTEIIVSLQESRNLWIAMTPKTRNDTGVVPPGTAALFHKWAKLIYKDSLLYAIARADTTGPVHSELISEYNADHGPDIALMEKYGLGIPQDTTIAFLTKILDASGNYDFVTAQNIEMQAADLLKHANQRSSSHYMSNMKDMLMNKNIAIELKVEYTRRFIGIYDAEMAKYPIEYFDQELRDPSLSPAQIKSISDLLTEINTKDWTVPVPTP